jgi:hypothetical protein
MTSCISAELRREVELRAGGMCEYCLISENDTFVGCQVDHIIAEKHGGTTTRENLAFACAFCNRAKGTDIASLKPDTQALVRLFNPRTDLWQEHFSVNANSSLIDALTDVGEVTSRLLGFNDSVRVLERQALVLIGHFPPVRAVR